MLYILYHFCSGTHLSAGHTAVGTSATHDAPFVSTLLGTDGAHISTMFASSLEFGMVFTVTTDSACVA